GEQPAKARQRRRRAGLAGGCDALLGYRFLNCVARTPLGESWVVQGPDGRKEVARFLSGFQAPAEGADPFERLAALTHPGLLPLTLVHREANRAVLLGFLGERTLQSRLTECQARRLAGVPRGELLEWLRPAAQTFDVVRQEQGVQHLGLNPQLVH